MIRQNKIKPETEQLVSELVQAICDLAIANRLTGLWDHVRHEECKKLFNECDLPLIYLSEKKSRSNVEERAIQRLKLDEVMRKIARKL